jgi:hypothetical protein
LEVNAKFISTSTLEFNHIINERTGSAVNFQVGLRGTDGAIFVGGGSSLITMFYGSGYNDGLEHTLKVVINGVNANVIVDGVDLGSLNVGNIGNSNIRAIIGARWNVEGSSIAFPFLGSVYDISVKNNYNNKLNEYINGIFTK